MHVVPLELAEANALVARLHRHHKPVVGHRFSLGAVVKDALVGAVIVGRPVSRGVNHRTVLEVTRLVTDGTPNACSLLYAAAARAAMAMGYDKIQTYILATEPGTSLRAAGWECENAHCGGRLWMHTDGKPRSNDTPVFKQRWARRLRSTLPEVPS